MWRTARKNLYAHKLRLALTALAVVLGVAFMAGTFVLTDTLKHDVDGIFKQTTAGHMPQRSCGPRRRIPPRPPVAGAAAASPTTAR